MRNEQDFLETVKRIAIGAFRSTKPVEVVVGKVKIVDPLAVSVESALTLKGDFLIKTEKGCKDLDKGDSVVLLRVQGGQKYVVLDKVVK